MKSMAQQLEAICAKVEKNDFVMVLLCNLHESYNNLIITRKSWVYHDLNIEFVTTKLFHEELRKKDVVGSNEDGSAFVASASKTTFRTSSIN